jgi:uncharacterized membrane protein YebE (DUF533 family)
MLSAARADGAVDAVERARIEQRMTELGIDHGTRAALFEDAEIASDPYRIARAATNEEEAAEIYLASLCAIDADHWAETAYLKELQKALALPQPLVDELFASLTRETAARAVG